MDVVLFIFRRDFRVKDNIGLQECITYANKNDCKIIPTFIIDDKQVKKKDYFSNKSFQFLTESIDDLNTQIGKDVFIYEGNKHVLSYLEDLEYDVKAVFSNRDFTPYAQRRDDILEKECKKRQISCMFYDDYTLLDLNKVVSGSKSFYKVFTPFFNKVKNIEIQKVKNLYTKDLELFKKVKSTINLKDLYTNQTNPILKGGRTEAWDRLNKHSYKTYKDTRNFPHRKTTTMMSAYLKYGCISIREFYWYIYKKYGKDHELIRQLFWKEFYAYITYHFPHVLEGMIYDNQNNKTFKENLKNKILWQNDTKYFKAWCEGKTGFPIVDAGMRQMNETGFMHNRLRMITSMFLTKHLHVDWRWGEKYFATKLIDYDPASNNGGWQWSSGTGTDFNNYYRMFNPWIQTERFDIQCKYIIKWIPELNVVPIKDILKWYDTYKQHKGVYVKPIVDHAEQRDLTMDYIYKK